MIAKIAVSAATFAIDKPYSYRVPQGMLLQSGMRVQIPFGKANRRCEGVVLAVEDGDGDGLKPIDCCLDEAPMLSQQMLRLAAFMRERYFCTFFDAIRVMRPSGMGFYSKNQIALTEDRSWKDKTIRNPDARRILEFLEELGGQAEENALRKTVEDGDALETAVKYLQCKKWITCQRDLISRSTDKTEQIEIGRAHV